MGNSAAPDWSTIRHAYVDQGIPVRDICRTHGIYSQTLYRQADKQGWPRRRQRQSDAETRDSFQLLARLRRLAHGQIAEIEARRAAKRDPTSPVQSERDARALTALAKLIEQISAIEAKQQVRRDGLRDGTAGESQDDRARRRSLLADKLIAMLEQERGSPLPEGDHG